MTRAWFVAIAWAVIGLASVSPASSQPRFKLEPFDEAANRPELFAVRSAIVEGLLRPDAAAIEALLAADFDSPWGGPSDFLETLREAPGSLLELAATLSYGGGFVNKEQTRFCAPFWFAKPVMGMRYPDSLQPSEGFPWIVILPDVPVYERPTKDARRLGTVGLELVKLWEDEPPAPSSSTSGGEPPSEFAAIVFENRKGYIAARVLKYPDDDSQHACLGVRDGKWLLVEYGSR
jgi:hypothetical protein